MINLHFLGRGLATNIAVGRKRGIDSVREDYTLSDREKKREGVRETETSTVYIYKEKSLYCNDEQYHDRDRGRERNRQR